MLDVHLPHKPLHGVWEFLLHLFTITVGLLIATQIESCAEWRHHVHLAEAARASLRVEIENNLKELKAAQPELKKWRETVDDDLTTMGRIQDHPDDPDAQKASLSVSFSSITLDETAWKTAQTTGALSYMPYEEAQRYASIYQAQESLLGLEGKPLDDVAAIHGLLARFHWKQNGKIGREQADEMAGKMGEMRLHLATEEVLLQASLEACSAFLENRPARHDFQESLH